MNKITIITGAMFLSVTLLALLFKILHWKGGDFGLLAGMSGLALVFIPLLTRSFVNKNQHEEF